MTAGPAALRRSQQQTPAPDAGAQVARPSFHPPANDNGLPLSKLLVEWSIVIGAAMIAAALVWWIAV